AVEALGRAEHFARQGMGDHRVVADFDGVHGRLLIAAPRRRPRRGGAVKGRRGTRP
ncbi:MAG: hypothetical protein ACJA1L_000698, partial [Paracoccaceae bacterium]